jgi:hypothetical protein
MADKHYKYMGEIKPHQESQEPPKELMAKPHHHKQFFANPFFKWTVFVLVELIIVIFIFSLGIKVGRHEERFTQNWIQNYPRNFGGPQTFNVAFGTPGPFVQPHGLFGTVLSKAVDGKSLVIKGQDNVEKTVEIDSNTTIQKGFSTIKFSELKAKDSVIVIGDPTEQGEIDAKFIRVLN